MQRHGKDTVVMIDGTDFSEHADNTEFSNEVAMAETTTYGRSRRNYISGLGDGTVTTGGTYDDDAVGGPGAIFEPLIASGETVTFVYRVAGTGAGLPEKSVDVKVSKFSTSSPVADKVAWSAEMQMVGDTINNTVQV